MDIKGKIIGYVGVFLFIIFIGLGLYGYISKTQNPEQSNQKELYSIEPMLDNMKSLDNYTLTKGNDTIQFSKAKNGYLVIGDNEDYDFYSLENKINYYFSKSSDQLYTNESTTMMFTKGSILESSILKGNQFSKENNDYIKELDGNSAIVQEFLASYLPLDENVTLSNVKVKVETDSTYIKTVTFDFQVTNHDQTENKQLVLVYSNYNTTNVVLPTELEEYILLDNSLKEMHFTDTFDIILNGNTHTVKVNYQLAHDETYDDHKHFMAIATLYLDNQLLKDEIDIELNRATDKNILSFTLTDMKKVGIRPSDIKTIKGTDNQEYFAYASRVMTKGGDAKKIYVYDSKATLINTITSEIPFSGFSCKNARCYYNSFDQHAKIVTDGVQFYSTTEENGKIEAIEYKMTIANGKAEFQELKRYADVEIGGGDGWQNANSIK